MAFQKAGKRSLKCSFPLWLRISLVLLLCPEISLQSERGCTGRFLIQPATRIWTFLLSWRFCFCFFKTPCGFFPSWVPAKKSDAEELNSSDSFNFPTERKNFKVAHHCLQCLLEMPRWPWLENCRGRQALQTVPRHWALPVRPDIPGGGAGVEEENSSFQRRQILNT